MMITPRWDFVIEVANALFLIRMEKKANQIILLTVATYRGRGQFVAYILPEIAEKLKFHASDAVIAKPTINTH